MPRSPRFEVYKDKAGGYRWRLIAPNGEPIASGESYKTKAGALKGVDGVKRHAAIAPVKELPTD